MPKYFKLVACAGIAVNAIALAILYPLVFADYFFGFFGGEPGASTYTIFDKIDLAIRIPWSFVLLIASVGLLNRKEWARRSCVVGLAVSIVCTFAWLFFSLTYALTTPGEELWEILLVAPVMLLITAFEVLVILYLNGASVKGCMRGANG